MKKKKIICFIPIKKFSERLKSKNFRIIGGKPLYKHVIEKVIKTKKFHKIVIDTDSKEIQNFCKLKKINYLERLDHLKSNKANGNDLLKYWLKIEPNFDYYFQLHVTSPLIKTQTIKKCVIELLKNKKINSIFTAVKEYSWYWFKNKPVNFPKYKLQRSQTLNPIIRDITFLYGISKKEFLKRNSRIGSKPHPYFVKDEEAIDINEDFDLKLAKNFLEK
ncbi:acylneuraminate cytidylyltransferase family protein [Pelagibacterales bacterium SAG-MED27]|nr:acylneuraminate cytidylyltransferase family protein [Pelagibacterales bacterium SAG-MED27]